MPRPDVGCRGDVVHRDRSRIAAGEHRGGCRKNFGAVAGRVGSLRAGPSGAGVVGRKEVCADVHHCTVAHPGNKWTNCPVIWNAKPDVVSTYLEVVMPTLLHIDASARNRSVSRRIGAEFARSCGLPVRGWPVPLPR